MCVQLKARIEGFSAQLDEKQQKLNALLGAEGSSALAAGNATTVNLGRHINSSNMAPASTSSANGLGHGRLVNNSYSDIPSSSKGYKGPAGGAIGASADHLADLMSSVQISGSSKQQQQQQQWQQQHNHIPDASLTEITNDAVPPAASRSSHDLSRSNSMRTERGTHLGSGIQQPAAAGPHAVVDLLGKHAPNLPVTLSGNQPSYQDLKVRKHVLKKELHRLEGLIKQGGDRDRIKNLQKKQYDLFQEYKEIKVALEGIEQLQSEAQGRNVQDQRITHQQPSEVAHTEVVDLT